MDNHPVTEDVETTQFYTDHTVTKMNGKTHIKVGTPIEWAAYIKAGYIVNSNLRPVRRESNTYVLTQIAPEVPRYVAMLRDEEISNRTTDDEYIEFVNNHAEFFQTRRSIS